MKTFSSFILFSYILITGCNKEFAQKRSLRAGLHAGNSNVFTDHLLDSLNSGLTFTAKGNYTALRTEIRRKREVFKREYAVADETQKEVIIDSARNYFTKFLLNKIIPHWYGTVWDFNGYTNTPNKGVIACGYFISTSLKHAGVNMNRYAYAQQAGMNEAKTLAPDNSFHLFEIQSHEEIDSVVDILEKTFRDGLYTIGLSNHVGYLYVHNKTAYFIHSNYIEGYVMTEKARYSDAFASSIYVITDVSHNNFLIESWILNNEIPVVTD
jgi:hypothetical protein